MVLWVSQVQGPRSMEVLTEVLDAPLYADFRYFDCAKVRIAGQSCWISRSGFTNELGWEVYFLPDTDTVAIGERILAVGERFDERDFVGRYALERADRACQTWGMRVRRGVAELGRGISIGGQSVGQVCSSGYSPFQGCGVCIARLDDPDLGPGARVQVACIDGSRQDAELCALPMYDKERLIPRGKLVDIPTRPIERAGAHV